ALALRFALRFDRFVRHGLTSAIVGHERVFVLASDRLLPWITRSRGDPHSSARLSSRTNRWTPAGEREHCGPLSNKKPFLWILAIKPPGRPVRSTTSGARPSCFWRNAQANPESPAPTTTGCSLYPMWAQSYLRMAADRQDFPAFTKIR